MPDANNAAVVNHENMVDIQDQIVRRQVEI